MNKYQINGTLIELKKQYFISRIERILFLMDFRNEVYLFENQNIFRHPSILEKIQKVPEAIKILNNKEKEWLKKSKDGAIKTDNIYIYITDTLCALYNRFPTNKDIKRAISLSFEILAIKIILSPVYKNKQKQDLEKILEDLKTNKFENIDELYKLFNFENKLNPEINKFVKNWTRSITFDFKVKMNTLFLDIKNKLKKEKKVIDKETKENETFLTREEMFEDIAERLLDCSLNNFWVEEFKFMSARLIDKRPSSYSKIILKKRVFKDMDEVDNFKDKLLYLFNSKNTYLASEYMKYHMIFSKGINYGLKKMLQMKGMDYHTSRIVIDMFLIASLRNAGDDRAYTNFKAIDEGVDASNILYAFKPYDFITLRLDGIKRYLKKEENNIFGEENLKEYIKGNIKFHFNEKKDKIFLNIIKEAEKIEFKEFLEIFKDYVLKNPSLKTEVVGIFSLVFVEFKKEFASSKKKQSIEENKQDLVLNTLLSFIEVLKNIK